MPLELTVNPPRLELVQGEVGFVTITTNTVNTQLSVSDLPEGVTAYFSPNPTNTTSFLSLAVLHEADLGTKTIIVKGRVAPEFTYALNLMQRNNTTLVATHTMNGQHTFHIGDVIRFQNVVVRQGGSTTGEFIAYPEMDEVRLQVVQLTTGSIAPTTPPPAGEAIVRTSTFDTNIHSAFTPAWPLGVVSSPATGQVLVWRNLAEEMAETSVSLTVTEPSPEPPPLGDWFDRALALTLFKVPLDLEVKV